MRLTTREVLEWEALEERRNRPRIPLVTACRSCGRVIADGETYCEGCKLLFRIQTRDDWATRSVYQRRLVP